MVRAPVLRVLKAVGRPIALTARPTSLQVSTRLFHTTQPQATDGVYKAITEMRIRTPWIEALRKSREESTGAPESVKPDLTPKKMSDSFVKFVY
jgi:acyl-coenzyme A thioesterase 9